MDRELVEQVRQRANERCEYCRLPQSASLLRFPIDHVVARQHGGPTVLANLALCCTRCNLSKGPNLAGIDDQSGTMMRLYNPRTDTWTDHFKSDGLTIIGLTPVGRATVAVLNLNEPRRIMVRDQAATIGRWPG